ncbi:alpha-1,2-fucosyltransferase [Prolixibacteraceae bacterium Z1-6]|uniref:Alpha-1,2-fucosyltransferase n=1 Tax=Draconibacterium aestuarii TaxID=2998507 RepID=A0A9X3F7T0_9BACT|nr:alpha-1,2-fucosyltransferase [Prolixibacteraceae bacterium Z1-6]
MSKVYCSVYNGLGNQLFGYALGMHISKNYNKTLYIDLTKLNFINSLSTIGFKKDTKRKYELHKLGFVHPVKNVHHSGFSKVLKNIIGEKYLYADFRKSHLALNQVSKTQHIHSIGWGDFNIVKEIIPELREQLSPNFEYTPQIEEARKIILESNSVAIHVRRSDYLDSKIGKRFGGICTDSYYTNAINAIKGKVENPNFIIFSDDIEYVKNNMDIENSYIVDGNAGYVDLYLMSLCKHFILANSTFSFWAAILNKLKTKVVCVPEYWYNKPLENECYIPEEWMKIPIE